MKGSKRLAEERRYVREFLGDRCICERCAATLDTWSDLCNSDLSFECPGFQIIELARTLFSQRRSMQNLQKGVTDDAGR